MAHCKSRVEDLAVFGGAPAFAERQYVGRPNIGDRARLLRRFDEILERRWLTNNGPCLQELERRVAEMVGVKHCVATCNATVALEIAARALNFTGEVIVPSLTFVATAHVLHWQGITPVFCDVDPATHNLDPERVEAAITPRTTAILGVHLWGRPCDVEALTDIARRHDLKLMFDAAHAFGCSYRGEMIGNFGDAEVYSFHATKFLNTFEGGAVVTNDDDLAAKLRLMINFGFSDYDEVALAGLNGKMTEVAAAMGLTGLESVEDFIAVNRRNHELYRKELVGIPGVKMVGYDDEERCNYQYVVAEFDEELTGVSRDKMIEILWAENVIARRYFHPGCHRMEPYRTLFPEAGARLATTERLAARLISFPTGTAISPSDVTVVCRIVSLAVKHYDRLRRSLRV